MSLFKEWEELMNSQTDETIKKFWKEYSEGETTIYSDVLDHAGEKYTSTIKELSAKTGVRPVICMGFLDGIQDSLNNPVADLNDIDEETEFVLDIDLEKLYFNMNAAGADYLYTLPQWLDILGEEKMVAIIKDYRRSKIVVKGEKIGRNDPCPCGSGKKYKHCCGRN